MAFGAVWAAAMVVGLAAFSHHSASYLLPLLPPLAILAAGAVRAAWCDALSNHHAYAVVLLVPSAVVFLGGLYAASRGRAREVLMFVVAGFALVIAVHVPDLVF